ncbi:PqqD family peptide modification chaperone [Bacillus sp. FSL W7-1360]
MLQAEQNCGTEASFLMSSPLQLIDEVELIQGANDQYMLFHAVKQNYVRIPVVGVMVINMLDGHTTGHDVVKRLEEKYPTQQNIYDVVHHFFSVLRRSGVLNLEPEEEYGLGRFVRNKVNRPIYRLPLVKSLDLLNRSLEYIVGYVRTVPKTILHAVVVVLLLSSLLSIVLSIYHTDMVSKIHWVSWPLLIVAIILHLVVHELSHAFACAYYGTRIREAGVGLLYYFIPVAYVDRTDSYRIKKKKGRAMIALAGPGWDLFAAGIWAMLAMWLGGSPWGATAYMIAMMLLLLFISNLNLLLPTDGYHAFEAATGELSLRNRSLKYLYLKMTRKPLSNLFQNVSKSRRFIYLLYAVLSFCYVFFLLSMFIYAGYSVYQHMR